MATIWVNGMDLEVMAGFQMTNEGNVLNSAVVLPREVEIPTVPGSFFVGPGRVAVREFVVRGHVTGTTFDLARDNLTLLQAILGPGSMMVRLFDRADIMIQATCVGCVPVNQPPQFVTPYIEVEITFRTSMPYWRDVQASARWFGSISSPTPMPMGSASVAPDYWLFGSVTNPVLKGYDFQGNEVWSSTFTITLGANDALRIVSSAFDMTIWKYVATPTGVLDDTLLTAGVFPRPLHATEASYRFGQWQMLGTTAPRGVAVYPRHWV